MTRGLLFRANTESPQNNLFVGVKESEFCVHFIKLIYLFLKIVYAIIVYLGWKFSGFCSLGGAPATMAITTMRMLWLLRASMTTTTMLRMPTACVLRFTRLQNDVSFPVFDKLLVRNYLDLRTD